MNTPTIKLKPQRAERLYHPWIYDNEVASSPDGSAGFVDGDIVKIVDSRGRTLGYGYCNTQSKIAVRYLTRRFDQPIDSQFWAGKVAAAFQYRADRYAASGTPGAYRLIHGEADSMPGLVVDMYGSFAVTQFLALGLEKWREDIIAAIRDVTGCSGIYERSVSVVRQLEGLEGREGVVWGDAPPDLLEIYDSGATLLVDIKNGAKTGLFLDQRENQLAAAREAKDRDVLNCFSYTGLFSLRAAQCGAKSVTDVESSTVFNAVNAAQWEKNGYEIPHAIIADNVFDYLRSLDKANYKTDMIVLDPPAFTKNRASRDGAIRGYNEINRTALKMINSGGVLVTCSCSHHLAPEEFREVVHAAARDAKRTLKLIQQRGQPPDHPVQLDVPESEYLKCLIFSVE